MLVYTQGDSAARKEQHQAADQRLIIAKSTHLGWRDSQQVVGLRGQWSAAQRHPIFVPEALYRVRWSISCCTCLVMENLGILRRPP